MTGGPGLSFSEFLVTSQVDGTAFTSSTAASIIPAAARFALPANFFSQIGKMLRIKARGRLSCTATPGTLAFNVMLGPTSNINVFGSSAFNLNTRICTNVTWAYEAHLLCRSIGAATAATILGIGNFESEAASGVAATAGLSGVAVGVMLPLTAPAVGAGFDSTVVNYLDLFAAFGTNAINSLTCHHYSVESLN